MTNAEKFQRIFGYYATEIWAKSESEFLEWINSEYPYTEMDLELEEIWEDMREADDEDGAKMERK